MAKNRRFSAKKKGDLTESYFYAACVQYRMSGKLSFQKTFPEFVETGKAKGGVKGFWADTATADWVLGITDLGARLCWIDTKGIVSHESGHSLTGSAIHQYRQMADDTRDCGSLGFFLVEWLNTDNAIDPEWYLFPVETLGLSDSQKSIRIRKTDGLAVPRDMDGKPLFLDAVIQWASNTAPISPTFKESE